MKSYIGNEPISQAAGYRTEAIATAGQTTFIVSYAVGYVDVFLNGAKLGAADFTATDGSTVVLAQACASGDVVAFIAWAKGEMLPAADFAPIGRPNGNFLINGDMSIWQRGVGPFNVAAGGQAYTADRWFLFANQQPQVARFVAFGTSGVVVGQTGIEQALQIDNPPAGAYFSLVQHVEDPAQFNGRLLTFSFYSNRLITPATSCIAQINFGTGGSTPLNLSPTALVAEAVPGTTHFRNRCTIQVPVLTGYTFGTGPYLLIGIQAVPPTGGFGGNVNVYGFKLENGSVMTDFERRQRGEELALCQRFYFRGQIPCGGAFSTGAPLPLKLPVTMRVTPAFNGAFSVGAGSGGTPGYLFSSAEGCVVHNTANNWTVGVGVAWTGDANAEFV